MKYIKKIVHTVSGIIFLKYGLYGWVIFKNRLLRLFYPVPEHKFLFVLSPPFCGSTLISEILMSSKNVSINNVLNSKQYEGQKLPSTSKIMFDKSTRWDRAHDFDWDFIKKEWLKYWDQTKPVLLEKSPPNIIRAQSIESKFSPAYFVVLYRNPYAHCESAIRRAKKNALQAAKQVILHLENQKRNIQELNNVLAVSYEDLTDNTTKVLESLSQWLEELSDIKEKDGYKAHSQFDGKMSVSNLNQDKIDKLSSNDLEIINSVFKKNEELLHFFGYQLID